MNEAVDIFQKIQTLTRMLAVRHRHLPMYQVSFSTFVSYMHIHVPFNNVLLEVGGCFPRILLNMMMFIGSQSFISLPSFIFVSALVSELCKMKQNKNNSEIGYFQFNTFPGLIIHPLLT